jgi:murein DD-endopeptidase MepM/ murein hydrolase activator NlpD
VKRNIIFLVLTSILLSSCIGNTSLWGQYQTPTPVGWIPETATPAPDIVVTDVNSSVDIVTPTDIFIPTVTPTSLANFVTNEPVTQPPVEVAPTMDGESILYYAQSGDWLPAVANRFGVDVNEITSPKILPENGYLDEGTLLIIPDRLDKTIAYTSSTKLIPNSEVIFSSTATDFDVEQYVKDAGGYLSTYREYLGTTAWTSGAQEVERLAFENSINPRLILALLDYEANWVRGRPQDKFHTDYPMGHENYRNLGMFGQMAWAINQLSAGYYGWRKGSMTELVFNDGNTLRLDPTLNAGTVAVMTLFSRHHSLNEWLRIMDVNSGFPFFYQNMFGDPWTRADSLNNLLPPGLSQPAMTLPIKPGATWAFTGGPHGAWEADGPLAAVDFAPANDRPGCYIAPSWVVAMAPGLVVRSGNGVVMVDMDGDGSEQTGWNILYLHIADKDRVALGQWLEQDGLIGHASCEGGISTGTHVHIARKYNGEWMAADGPIPFVMDGWQVTAGTKPYLGNLVNGDQNIKSDLYGQAWSLITRKDDK